MSAIDSSVKGLRGAAPSASRLYSRQDRTHYLTLIGLAMAALGLARLLQPSPRGFGTHEQLGLPPCFFLKLTGLPCPSCGLTTSLAHAARFHFFEAFITQPFGLLAFFIAVLLIPLLCYLLYRRVPWQRFIGARGANVAMYTLIALYLLAWAYKIAAMRG